MSEFCSILLSRAQLSWVTASWAARWQSRWIKLQTGNDEASPTACCKQESETRESTSSPCSIFLTQVEGQVDKHRCGSHFSLPREPHIKCSSSFMGPWLGKEQDRRASGVEKYFGLRVESSEFPLLFPLRRSPQGLRKKPSAQGLCESDRNEAAWAKLVRMWKSRSLCENADPCGSLQLPPNRSNPAVRPARLGLEKSKWVSKQKLDPHLPNYLYCELYGLLILQSANKLITVRGNVLYSFF